MRNVRLWLITAFFAAVLPCSAHAEPTVPSRMDYQATASENAEAKLCMLVLEFAQPPNPETVKAIAVVGLDKKAEVITAAFILAVADEKRSGDTTSFTVADLASAGMSSPTFDTAGLEQQKSDDKSIWIWLVRDNVLTFLDAYMKGGFRVVFSRTQDGRLREYRIDTAPPESVQNEFVTCSLGLVPETPPPGSAGRSGTSLGSLKRGMSAQAGQSSRDADRRVIESAARTRRGSGAH